MNPRATLLSLPLALATIATTAQPAPQPSSQPTPQPTPSQAATDAPRPASEAFVSRTFYLATAGKTDDANEITNALRNMLSPSAKVYLVPSQNAIVMSTTPDQLALAEKLIADLNRARKAYRLTYTVTETEAGHPVGAPQHFSLVVVTGQRTILKQGSKVPIVTGSYNPGTSNQNTQVTYLDVGMNIDASLDESAEGVRLRTKIEQSSIAEEKSGLGTQDPIVRQAVLEGTANLTPGKPVLLGSIDVPGSTRHLEIETRLEPVR